MIKKLGLMLLLLITVFVGCNKEIKDSKVTVKYKIPDGWKEQTVNKTTVKLISDKKNVKITIDKLAKDEEKTSEDVIASLKNQILGTLVKNKVKSDTYKISSKIKDAKIAEEDFKYITYIMSYKDQKVVQNFYSTKIDNTIIRIDTTSKNDTAELDVVNLINTFEFKTVGEA